MGNTNFFWENWLYLHSSVFYLYSIRSNERLLVSAPLLTCGVEEVDCMRHNLILDNKAILILTMELCNQLIPIAMRRHVHDHAEGKVFDTLIEAQRYCEPLAGGP